MFCELLIVVLITFHTTSTAPVEAPSPPRWPSVWMATGSAHYSYNNQTTSAQIFYDWTRPIQVMNSMREDSYTYTIMHNGTTVWRLERANRSCCIDPSQTGVTPPKPDWLQVGNQTKYDGIVTVMEHACHSWTKDVPDVATFSWLTSVATGIPCRLGWLSAVNIDFSYYSENRDLLPKGIFDVPDYCPHVFDSLDWIMNAMARVKMARTEPPRIKQEASPIVDTRIPVEEESNDEQDV
ncbi:unnamed protein product [Adineta steineri]|uniref:Uncharacterized protein n=1 Tax=Adineta steineri TaxID=433720 RepID=A0A814L448_9BILA|nr:unnamed protein product [Adineta steineri]